MSRHAQTLGEANIALLGRGELDRIGEFFAPDYVVHLTDRDMRGHDAVRGFLEALRSSFTDLEVDIEVLLEAGDRIAWQRTVTATHTGDFKGFPASGRPVAWRDMLTSRFRDGLLAEDWAISDLAERLLLARKR